MVHIEGLDRALEEHPFFAGMDPAVRETIAGCAANERFKAGDFIFREGGKAAAIAMKLVREKKLVDFAGVRLSWQPGQASALDTAQISKGRDVGTIIAQRTTSAGKLVDVPYDVTFAFVFHAFNAETKIKTE